MKLEQQNTDYLEGPECELEKKVRSLTPKYSSAKDALLSFSAELDVIARQRGKNSDELLAELEESSAFSEEGLRVLSLIRQIAHLKSVAR